MNKIAKSKNMGNNKADVESAFIREVNDDIYGQRLLDFWKKYHIFIYIYLIVVILGTAGYEFTGYLKSRRIEREAIKFEKVIDALASKNSDVAVALMNDLIKTGHYGYKDMAFVNLYSYYLSKNDIDNAIKILNDMQHNAYSKSYRHYAIVQYAYLKSDNMKSPELHKFLKPVLKNNYGFKYDAMYMMAVKYISEGNLKAADNIIKSLHGHEHEIPTFFRSGFGKVKTYLDVKYNDKK